MSIKHIEGCGGGRGCRCSGYVDLNPHLYPPEHYKAALDCMRAALLSAPSGAFRDEVQKILDSEAEPRKKCDEALNAALSMPFVDSKVVRGKREPLAEEILRHGFWATQRWVPGKIETR